MKIHPEDTLTVTMVFDLDRVPDPKARSNFHGDYLVWLDPEDGLWVKLN